MQANEFVKKFWWEVAKDIVKNCPPMGFLSNPFIKDNGACVRVLTKPSDFEVKLHDDLKRIVKSHRLIEEEGGIDRVKDTFGFAFKHGADELTEYGKRVKQAIADVESCL